MAERLDSTGRGRIQDEWNSSEFEGETPAFGADFDRYNPKVFDAIPLHKPKAKRKIERKGESVEIKVGKRPLHPAWTTAKYDTRKVVDQCQTDARNMGIRPKANQLIIDIDPRNGGDEGFAELCEALGDTFVPTDYPCVTTGSGGRHLYMTKPPALKVLDTIKDRFPGVEFKSTGRQVLAAGCIHPDTGKPYTFTPGHPDINDLKPGPAKLWKLIERPVRAESAEPGGHIANHKLAAALEGLDPEKFRDHEEWLQLMMACHHATGGEGRQEFIEWSIQDSEYSDMAEDIGRRWDSLHAERDDGVTVASLNRQLVKAKRNDLLLPTKAAADEFAKDGIEFVPEPEPRERTRKDDDDGEKAWGAEFDAEDPDDPDRSEFEGADLYSPESLSLLEQLNERYVAVAEGGRFLIAYIEDDAEQPGIKRFRTLTPYDFEKLHSNIRLERDPEAAGLSRNAAETIELGKAWLQWPHRRTAFGWTFDHKATAASVIGKDFERRLNRWFGWRVDPKKGDWTPIREMIRDIICDGNTVAYDYLIRWIAYRFRNPHKRMGVCVTIKGEEGIGKGVLGSLIAWLFGAHGLSISDPQKLVGRFSGHLVMKIFIFLDEALRPEIPTHETRLKQIVTENTIDVEPKFKDVTDNVNRLGLYQASNNEWTVRASKTARRYFVLKASSKRRVDRSEDAEFDADNIANKTYWRDLVRFIYQEGGAAAFLHAMLNFPLGDWEPMEQMVETSELAVDKRRNFAGQDLWMDSALTSGKIPGGKDDAYDDWVPEEFELQALVNRCNGWLESQKIKARTTMKKLAPLLRDAGFIDHKRHGNMVWRAPNIADARAEFSRKRLAGNNPYSEDEGNA